MPSASATAPRRTNIAALLLVLIAIGGILAGGIFFYQRIEQTKRSEQRWQVEGLVAKARFYCDSQEYQKCLAIIPEIVSIEPGNTDASQLAERARSELSKADNKRLVTTTSSGNIFRDEDFVPVRRPSGGSTEPQSRSGPNIPTISIMGGLVREGQTTPQGMVLIPSSFSVRAGSQENHPAFYIDKNEVMAGEYDDFVQASGYRPPGYTYSEADREKPVRGLSRWDAERYASWVDKRLPNEVELSRLAGTDLGMQPGIDGSDQRSDERGFRCALSLPPEGGWKAGNARMRLMDLAKSKEERESLEKVLGTTDEQELLQGIDKALTCIGPRGVQITHRVEPGAIIFEGVRAGRNDIGEMRFPGYTPNPLCSVITWEQGDIE